MARPQLLESVQDELWRRWKGGENVHTIARALELPNGSVHHVLVLMGGKPRHADNVRLVPSGLRSARRYLGDLRPGCRFAGLRGTWDAAPRRSVVRWDATMGELSIARLMPIHVPGSAPDAPRPAVCNPRPNHRRSLDT
jgi:hypothetical protein